MLNGSVKKFVTMIGVIILPLTLFGCQGSSTYGTGKTSGEHLLEGIGAITGGRTKKARIDYSPRPGLVTPPKNSALPQPLEGDSTYVAGLPESPEQQRVRLRGEAPKAKERSGELPIEFLKRKRDPNAVRLPAQPYKHDEVIDANYNPKYSRKRFLKQKAEIAGVSGAAPRRYLTEPPKQYRTPLDTAPVGEIGEDEDVKAKRYKKKKGFSWSSLNPFS